MIKAFVRMNRRNREIYNPMNLDMYGKSMKNWLGGQAREGMLYLASNARLWGGLVAAQRGKAVPAPQGRQQPIVK